MLVDSGDIAGVKIISEITVIRAVDIISELCGLAIIQGDIE
jgi:hypothetical protein